MWLTVEITLCLSRLVFRFFFYVVCLFVALLSGQRFRENRGVGMDENPFTTDEFFRFSFLLLLSPLPALLSETGVFSLAVLQPLSLPSLPHLLWDT